MVGLQPCGRSRAKKLDRFVGCRKNCGEAVSPTKFATDDVVHAQDLDEVDCDADFFFIFVLAFFWVFCYFPYITCDSTSTVHENYVTSALCNFFPVLIDQQ